MSAVCLRPLYQLHELSARENSPKNRSLKTGHPVEHTRRQHFSPHRALCAALSRLLSDSVPGGGGLPSRYNKGPEGPLLWKSTTKYQLVRATAIYVKRSPLYALSCLACLRNLQEPDLLHPV
jgi:hypothetical protein